MKRWTICVAFLATLIPANCDICVADDKPASAESLIRSLQNSNPPPRIVSNSDGVHAKFPTNYDWSQQAKSQVAWEQLNDRFAETLPVLVLHVADKEYCITVADGNSGAEHNWTVGEVCQFIIVANIEPYRRPHSQGDPYQGFLVSFDKESPPQLPRAIQRWWKDRNRKTLQELQSESIEWQSSQLESEAKELLLAAATATSVRSEKRLRYLANQIGPARTHLKLMYTELQTEGALRKAISWRIPDEMSFRNRPTTDLNSSPSRESQKAQTRTLELPPY
jgi:hypothetical protein